MALDLSTAKPEDVRVLVAGCTGYIGRFVTKELMKRGYKVVAFSREKSGVGGKKSMDVRKMSPCACLKLSSLISPTLTSRLHVALRQDVRTDFEGADVCFGDVTSMESLRSVAFKV
jgi:nucleoside-diphosphate-sugar epimerase